MSPLSPTPAQLQMGGPKSLHPADLAVGGTIQCLEAASLGMPFEVPSWMCHILYSMALTDLLCFLFAPVAGVEDAHGPQP